jgi:predicted ATPase with chaperone activity
MRSTEHHATGTRLSQPLAAAILSVGCLLLSPAAHAQNQPLARPQGQLPSPTISDQKLDAAAAAIEQMTSIKQSYEQKIAEAPPSDKQHITDEANNALKKAVTDQGLSVDEYNTIVQTAQNDPAIRLKLVQRIRPSGQ